MTELTPIDAVLVTSTPADDVQDSGAGSPYAFFAHTRNRKLNQIVQSIGRVPKDGEPILSVDGKFVPLSPFKFMLNPQYLCQYWAQVDDQNNFTATSRKQQRARPWAEYFDVIAFIFYGDSITPARITFKGPKCPAVRTLLAEIREASDLASNWAGKSKAHAQASEAIKTPALRIVADVTMTHQTPSGGFPYDVADCTARPITSEEFQTVSDVWQTDAFKQAFAACVEDLNKRLTLMTKKAV